MNPCRALLESAGDLDQCVQLLFSLTRQRPNWQAEPKLFNSGSPWPTEQLTCHID